jgi:diphosphomevalonate decarboxylase
MEGHPYAPARFSQARKNIQRLKSILHQGNWPAFISLLEEEALSLHALMMSGQPGYLLMQPATLQIIREVRNFRAESGLHLGFTLDAGANVHLLYPASQEEGIRDFIDRTLRGYCEEDRMIHDQMGQGPKPLEE